MTSHLRNTEKVNNLNDDDELRKHGYVVGVTLGEGSYAKVKSAFCEHLQKKVALKIINRRKAPKDFQQKFLPRELEVMKLVHHPNCIQMYEVMQFNGKVYISMEVAGHGDLLEYIKLRGAIQEDRARVFFQQMINAVEYLHNHNVVHRDLKCENILLDTSNNIKVTDFGFARLLMPEELSKTFCGSAAYAAPEILQGIPYNGPSYDIWSMGVILYIMVCGSMPYDDSNIKKMIKSQTEKKVGFSRSKKLSNECKELIHVMLEAVVKLRADMRIIQRCNWLQPLRGQHVISSTTSGQLSHQPPQEQQQHPSTHRQHQPQQQQPEPHPHSHPQSHPQTTQDQPPPQPQHVQPITNPEAHLPTPAEASRPKSGPPASASRDVHKLNDALEALKA